MTECIKATQRQTKGGGGSYTAWKRIGEGRGGLRTEGEGRETTAQVGSI